VENSSKSRRDAVGGAFVALAAFLFGGVVVLGKTAEVEALPVPSMLSIRFAVAGVALALILAASRGSLRPARREGRWLLALGGIGYATESALFFLALSRGTAATVTLLFYTYPVLVTLLSAALGLGVPGLLLGGSLVAAVAGAALVVGSSGGIDITALGIVFALASALTFSVYLLTADQMVRRSSSLVAATGVSLSASVTLAAYSIVTGTGELPRGSGLLAVSAMGLLTAGAFTFLFLGLRRVGAVRTSIIASLEPVNAAVLALIFLGESLRAGVLAGGALILAAAIVASLARGVPDPERAVP
jgi:drug/metabolite transporter (DMT)-like permease